MPNQTFFNLPEAKKKVILHAAKQEFSRVPLYEASITNIIKEADIARGSFYQYFEDKGDLYFYLLQIDAEARRKAFLENIQENNGDLFRALEETFNAMINEIDNDDARKFYRHVFLNMNYKTEKTFMSNKQDAQDLDQYVTDITAHIDTSNLNLQHDTDLHHIIQISASVMLQNIIQKFALNLSNEETIHSFNLKLELLKSGFEKNR